MEEAFLPFRKFCNREEAAEFGRLLDDLSVPFKIENRSPYEDIFTLYSVSPSNSWEVNIRAVDLDRVNEVLNNMDKRIGFDEDSSFNGFAVSELIDILNHFDQWNETEYREAVELLKQKGIDYTDEQLEQLKQKRIDELRKPVSISHRALYMGWLFAIAFGFFGMFYGYYIWKTRKTLPNGERVWTFDEKSRKKGAVLFLVSIFLFISLASYFIYSK
jgi:hypothetical protein